MSDPLIFHLGGDQVDSWFGKQGQSFSNTATIRFVHPCNSFNGRLKKYYPNGIGMKVTNTKRKTKLPIDVCLSRYLIVFGVIHLQHKCDNQCSTFSLANHTKIIREFIALALTTNISELSITICPEQDISSCNCGKQESWCLSKYTLRACAFLLLSFLIFKCINLVKIKKEVRDYHDQIINLPDDWLEQYKIIASTITLSDKKVQNISHELSTALWLKKILPDLVAKLEKHLAYQSFDLGMALLYSSLSQAKLPDIKTILPLIKHVVVRFYPKMPDDYVSALIQIWPQIKQNHINYIFDDAIIHQTNHKLLSAGPDDIALSVITDFFNHSHQTQTNLSIQAKSLLTTLEPIISLDRRLNIAEVIDKFLQNRKKKVLTDLQFKPQKSTHTIKSLSDFITTLTKTDTVLLKQLKQVDDMLELNAKLSVQVKPWLTCLTSIKDSVKDLSDDGLLNYNREIVANKPENPLNQCLQKSEVISAENDALISQHFSRYMNQVLLSIWHGLLRSSYAYLQEQWQQQVISEWVKYRDMFPVSLSEYDMSYQKFSYLFKPNEGIVNKYINYYLNGFISINTQTYQIHTWLNQGMELDKAFLDSLMRSTSITSAMFEQDKLGFNVQFYPQPDTAISELRLLSAQDSLLYRNQQQSWYPFIWPGENKQHVSSLFSTSSSNGEEYSLKTAGKWSLLKLLASASKVNKLQEGVYRLTWILTNGSRTLPVSLLAKFDNANNPIQNLLFTPIQFPDYIFISKKQGATEHAYNI